MTDDAVARALAAVEAVDAGALVDDPAALVALAREVGALPVRRRAGPRPTPRTPDPSGWLRRPLAS